MKIVTDQMQREVKIPTPPKRIISLVPSQTELLFYLGLEEEVVGITKFCVHPRKQFKAKPRVGGTKQYHFDRIKTLQPDLIIGNKEENDQTQIEKLAEEYSIWMSDIITFEDALDMIDQIGKIIGKEDRATHLIENILAKFHNLNKYISLQTYRPKVAYMIWYNPMMVAARHTFIDQMLHIAGFQNIFESQTRYPSITSKELSAVQPDVILLSSEPFPFKEKHVKEIQDFCPNAVIELVDGELFSWYGNRLLLAAPYFEKIRSKIE